MGACCGNDEKYQTATKFYCHTYNTPCLTCGKTLPDKGIRTCNKICQYTILINDWVHKGTPINNAWKKALIAYAKAEGITTNELLKIKNNPLLLPKPEYVQTFDIFGNIEDNSKEFHEHYQQLAPIREEQEQCLEEINT
ncbi:hypothetical protein G9A89_005845 [Geosiphon pyriformis]|nr:hypothetical protein G9A89_005845 [Geosiphon pyriformis]